MMTWPKRILFYLRATRQQREAVTAMARDIAALPITILRTGQCIGGPAHGQQMVGRCKKMVVPCNPHSPRNPTPDSPSLEFDTAEYLWRDGAWYYTLPASMLASPTRRRP